MEITKFTKWIISQEKINILFKMRTQIDETKWSISATKITSTFFLSLRILSASCLALSNWLFLLERTLWWWWLRRWIIALKYQQGHECYCWITTFLWNKMMIWFVLIFIMIIKNVNVEYARVSLESFAVLLSNRAKSVFWRYRRRGWLKVKKINVIVRRCQYCYQGEWLVLIMFGNCNKFWKPG